MMLAIIHSIGSFRNVFFTLFLSYNKNNTSHVTNFAWLCVCVCVCSVLSVLSLKHVVLIGGVWLGVISVLQIRECAFGWRHKKCSFFFPHARTHSSNPRSLILFFWVALICSLITQSPLRQPDRRSAAGVFC